MMYLGGAVLSLGAILITYHLIKTILELDATLLMKEKQTQNKEEDWEDDTDWDWYEYDELDSKDDK